VNKELILFSMADNMRSIPSMIDGLKPGQRKVIYGAFKRNLVKDQKVAEFAGYVSEVAAYHHGEQSLQQTIVGLAQTYVGSNNINCLEPSGNFGSRLSGGSDAASARYIHTRLSPFARRVFSKLDEPNLEYQFDDGNMIEPKVYVPVIPMVLVNGADGIGTGWSTSIPNYHPIDIVENLKRRMGRLDAEDSEEKPFKPMTPWFRGWKGLVESEGPNRFKFNGIIRQDEQNPNEIHVTELPIRMWTDDFKSRLEDIIRAEKTPSFIKDYREFNDHKTVHFIIDMDDKHLKAALDEGLLEKFKLTKSITTTNLVAFNTLGQIKKYESPEEIMEEYYHYRLQKYTERKVCVFAPAAADFADRNRNIGLLSTTPTIGSSRTSTASSWRLLRTSWWSTRRRRPCLSRSSATASTKPSRPRTTKSPSLPTKSWTSLMPRTMTCPVEHAITITFSRCVTAAVVPSRWSLLTQITLDAYLVTHE
jgi:DNA topoisomerase-2